MLLKVGYECIMQFSARVVGVELVIKHKDILMGGGGECVCT